MKGFGGSKTKGKNREIYDRVLTLSEVEKTTQPQTHILYMLQNKFWQHQEFGTIFDRII